MNRIAQTQDWQNNRINPDYFYYVPTPQPTALPVLVTVYQNTIPPSPVCPGCGRCRYCGKPTPPIEVTFSC